MGTAEKYNVFQGFEAFLRCPVCGASFRVEQKSLVCENGHCYDFSAKGYVNFLTNKTQASKYYSKKLFESRAEVFASGAYLEVFREIRDVISMCFGGNQNIRLFDAGCGEGYYAAKLSGIPGIDVFAADIVKDAIIAACGKKTSTKCMVADLTNIPLRENSMNVVLNVLAIANYDEFQRILSDDGIVIKVVPGDGYLKEIRDIVRAQLHNKSYSNEGVTGYFENRLKLIDKREVCYKFPMDARLAQCFTEMTPLTFGLSVDPVSIREISEITIHLDILTGRVRNALPKE